VCLESKDFIQIRNALIVLKRILPYYPKVMNLANAVERWIERVSYNLMSKVFFYFFSAGINFKIFVHLGQER